MRQPEQQSEQQQRDDDGQQPPFLVVNQELTELHQQAAAGLFLGCFCEWVRGALAHDGAFAIFIKTGGGSRARPGPMVSVSSNWPPVDRLGDGARPGQSSEKATRPA